MIELDGKYGEGGGALVRSALALATLTDQEFKVTNIRAGRPQPGLKAQHLTAVKALQLFSDAKTNAIELGSTELHFKPGQIKKGIFSLDIGTAGGISLLLQAITIPALFAPGKVTFRITGGTSGKWQAPVDYIQNILFPHLQRFVDKIELKVLKRGYYPRGGGLVVVEITPRFKLKEYDSFASLIEELRIKTAKIKLAEQGNLEQIRGVITVSRELQDKEVGERIKKAAETSLKHYGVPITLRVEYVQTSSIGGEIVLWSVFSNGGKIEYDNPVILGGDALVEKGKSSEQIGKEAAEKLQKEIDSGAAVDHYLTDQLIPVMGLLPDSCIKASEISDHALTNIYVTEKFLPVGFKIEGNIICVEEK